MNEDPRIAIVEKAIFKAITNGWRGDELRQDKRYTWPPKAIHLHEDRDYYSNSGWWVEDANNRYSMPDFQVCQSDNFEDLIYDHDFAKALWGDGNMHDTGGKLTNMEFQPIPLWRTRLKEMVVADDTIAYLGEHL